MELTEALKKLTLQVDANQDHFNISEIHKIDEILDIGRQIEDIYKRFFLNQPGRQHAIDDIYAYRKLCDHFITLCWNESTVCDLPTISMYNQYHMELMGHLNDLISSSQSSTASRQSSNSSSGPLSGLNSTQDESSFCQSASTENMNDEHVLMDEGSEAFDCDQFEWDRHQLDGMNWTTNKLYIDGSNK